MNALPDSHLVPGRTLHDHSRPDGERRDRQHGDDHPLGPCELRIHAQDEIFLVRDAFEDLVHTFGAKENLLLLRVFVHVLPLGVQLQARAPDTRLVAPAASMTLTTDEQFKKKVDLKSGAPGPARCYSSPFL